MKYVALVFTDEDHAQLYKQKAGLEMPEQGTIKRMKWTAFLMILSNKYKETQEK